MIARPAAAATRANHAQPRFSLPPGQILLACFFMSRRRALYALSRILADPDGRLTVEPVGASELRVRASDGPTEWLRVTDSAEPLTVEALLPGAVGFLRQALAGSAESASLMAGVVSFAPLAPALTEGWKGAGPARQPLVWALGEQGFSAPEIDQLFSIVRLPVLDAQSLERQLATAFTPTIGAPEVERTIALFAWALDRNETLTRAGLVSRLAALSRYLPARAQLGLTPLDDRELSPARRQHLADEVRQHAPIRHEHILAGADRPRPALLDSLAAALADDDLVVLHGALGAGASALAYRYLQDRVPEALRFQLDELPDPDAAARLARQLATHAQALGLPLYVLAEVRPRDRQWPEAAARFVGEEPQKAGLKLVCTIAGEHWRHALLAGLGPRVGALAVPVENTFSIDSLKIELRTKIENLGADELARLERSAVAAACDARIGLARPELDPLVGRSLTAMTGSWLESALECLPLLAEEDLESFLLDAFVRHESDSPRLIDALFSFQPRRLEGQAGVLRALLWQGVRAYVDNLQPLLQETRERLGSAWSWILDTELRGLPGMEGWLDAPGLSADSQALVAELRARQPPLDQIFALARRWLAHLQTEAPAPRDPAGFRALAELRFWYAHLDQPAPPMGWLTAERLTQAATELPLETLGELLTALSYDKNPSLRELRNGIQQQVLERFISETETPFVERTEEVLRAHFVVDPGSPEILRDRALRRLTLLRALAPDHPQYAVRGYGHQLGAASARADETEKLPVPARQLPPVWLFEVKSLLLQRAELAFRPADSDDHARQALALRRTAVACLRELVEALGVYFRKREGVQLPGTLLDVAIWERSSLAMSRPPRLPRTAVDDWGLAGEAPGGVAPPAGLQPIHREQRALALVPFQSYLRAQDAFWPPLTTFLRRAIGVLALHSLSGKGRPQEAREAIRQKALEVGISPEAPLASLNDLGRVLEGLARYQQTFRDHFADHVGGEDLDLLERRERETLAHAFSLWHRFALHPGQTVDDPGDRLPDARKVARDTLRRHLRKLSKDAVDVTLLPGELPWAGEPSQWITFDVRSPARVYAAFLAVHRALLTGMQEVHRDPLQWQALALSARRIVVVPLVRGKSLQRAAWVLTREALTGQAAAVDQLWLHDLHHVARADEWAEAGIATWEAERLAWAERLQASVRALYEATAHLGDLARLGQPPGLAQTVLERHVAARLTALVPILRQLTDETAAILRYLQTVPAAERQERVALVAAVQRLADFYQNSIAPLFPADGTPPTLAHLTTWTRHLESTIGETEIFRLLWSADALDLPLTGD
jgi:hypothetical protein